MRVRSSATQPQSDTKIRSPFEPQRQLCAAGLFAGIGGFELGLERAGHRTRLFCELDPVARAVLRTHFPRVPILHDVRRLDELLERLPSQTDLLTAGFPCQDLSQAGGTRGIDGKRSKLISHVFTVLQSRPIPWVLIENVSFMLRLDRGRAMKRLVNRLERLGYRWAYRVVDSNAFGLPQRRERVFLLASLSADPRDVLLVDDASPHREVSALGHLAHGFYWSEGNRGVGWAVDAIPTLKGGSAIGIPSPPAIVLPNKRIILPDIRDAERMQGFDEDWTLPAERAGRRSARWRLIGNAVTVDVARWIGSRLASPGDYDGSDDETLKRGSSWPIAAWYDGRRRGIAEVSKYPCWSHRPHLHRFLRHDGTPLTLRATEGFLSRALASTLRFEDGFIDALKEHYERVSGRCWRDRLQDTASAA